ncbi:MAG: hypothetical protein DRO93_08335 [Candidatus Thorarchaeota archaeon]|nr:MAG: hypothetical protein DRO93_08335 [Candidatus Thorarchaeota archaeon]
MSMPIVFVGIKTHPGQSDAVRDALSSREEVRSICKLYAGQYDVVMVIEVPSLEKYHEFVAGVLADHEGVIDFESFIAV